MVGNIVIIKFDELGIERYSDNNIYKSEKYKKARKVLELYRKLNPDFYITLDDDLNNIIVYPFNLERIVKKYGKKDIETRQSIKYTPTLCYSH